MAEQIFLQLAIILATAFVLSYISRLFKQPIIIGYIIAGIVISPFILKLGVSTEIIETLSKFGVAFLLFMVGLHLNPKVIKEVGTSSLLVGLAQIVLTFALGFFISLQLLNLGMVTSIYIGIALAFSSTIIVMKFLSDRGYLESLHGKISIGILIVQDLVAVAVLMFISSVSKGTELSSFALKSIAGGIGLILVIFLAGYFVLPKLTKSLARSQELLFLFSITWAIVIAALFEYIGFSIEIGALIAGVALSVSPYGTEISSKVRPLRDFFLIIFFIILGLNIQISNIQSIILNAAILSGAVLVFKPLILTSLTALFGYTKRTNFLTGTTLAQISEFSLIVLSLGVAVGHISSEILSTMTLTAIITITLSSYMIIYGDKIYKNISGMLSIFEKKKVKREKKVNKKYDAILFGYNRIGFGILRALKKVKQNYLIVDFNPDVISDLNKLEIPAIYGDAFDQEFLEKLPLDKSKIIISTIPEFETNILLIQTIRMHNPKAIIIVRSHDINKSLELYDEGADYVLTPHFVGGEHIAKMIKNTKTRTEYKKEKERHIESLKDILNRGKRHPNVERG